MVEGGSAVGSAGEGLDVFDKPEAVDVILVLEDFVTHVVITESNSTALGRLGVLGFVTSGDFPFLAAFLWGVVEGPHNPGSRPPQHSAPRQLHLLLRVPGGQRHSHR